MGCSFSHPSARRHRHPNPPAAANRNKLITWLYSSTPTRVFHGRFDSGRIGAAGMIIALSIHLITKEKQMRLIIRVAVVGLVLMLAQGVVRAQGFFGGFRGNPLMLLGQESVQKELKLTDEQKTKTDELRQKSREKMQEIFQGDEGERQKKMQELNEENRKAVAGILNPEQDKRLKEITYQQRGATAFADPEVVKALNLSEEQQGKVKTINDDTQ